LNLFGYCNINIVIINTYNNTIQHKLKKMFAPQFSRNQASCKVCYDAGNLQRCNDHTTRGGVYPEGTAAVLQGGWYLNKEVSQVTLCPVLQNTVCTNPQCFNGQNGKIRFPCFGHSISHCPCKWPQGWNIGEPLEHMRYTGYTPEQWRQMEQQMMHQQMMQQQMMQQQMMQQQMMGAAQLAIAQTEENFPSPSVLERQYATTPVSSCDEEKFTPPPSPPNLKRKGAEIIYEGTQFPEPLETLSREEQLRMEIAQLRQKIQQKKKQKKKTTSWADMCDSEYESEEEHRWEDYDSESDGEFAKVAPQFDQEEQEEEEKGWSTVSTKGRGKKKQTDKNTGWDVIPQKNNTTQHKNPFLLLRSTS
jgi:hypothetical protein